MLFINVLKSLKNKKMILVSLVLIISLTITISNVMNLSLDNLENTYYNYLENQNVEHVYLSVINDYDHLKYQDLDFSIVDTAGKNLLIKYLYQKNNLSYSSLENIKNLLDKMPIIKIKQENILNNLQNKYHFSYERQQSKTIKKDKNNLILLNLDENKTINKPKLMKGRWPKKNGEIVGEYKKNLKINKTYYINKKQYKIVGLVYSPVYIYHIVNVLNNLEDKIFYLTTSDFNSIPGIINDGYAIKFDDYKRKYDFNKEDKNDLVIKLLQEENIDYNVDTITRNNRINYLKQEIDNNRILAKYFLTLLLLITLFINFIMMKKIIDNEKCEIGILKALGFSKFYIALSYLLYPIVAILIGSIIGFIISFLLIIPGINLYSIDFNIPITNYIFNFTYLQQIISLFFILPLFTLILSYHLVRKKSLSLLKDGSNIKVNIFTKLINKIFYFFPFKYRFRFSLVFRSLSRLLLITLTTLGASLLIVFILIISNLFNKIVDDSFKNMKFKYLVIFNSPLKEKGNSDYLLNITGYIKNKENINITGIDNKTKYFHITNKKIDANQIVINQNLKNKYNWKINDYVKVFIGNIEYQYKIIDITDGTTGYYGYVNREDLSKKIGYQEAVYNEMYSNDSKYINMENLTWENQEKINTILNIKDLKNNLKKQMNHLTISIYFIVFFSLIITFLVIVVIAFIVVDENKKNISLLKVIGYSDKKIGQMILNIYTPFIIIVYFIAIPLIKNIIKLVIKDIQKELDMILPVTISYIQIIIGLVVLLSVYYLAISLVKKNLKKVPLEMILKESR